MSRHSGYDPAAVQHALRDQAARARLGAAQFEASARAKEQTDREVLELSMGRALVQFFSEAPDLSGKVSEADRRALAREFVSRVLQVAAS